MRIDVHVFLHGADEPQQLARLQSLILALTGKVDTIMSSQTQLAADLAELKDQVTKIGNETTALLQKVTDLETAIANGGNTTPEVDAALAALKTQLKVVDDLVQDA